MSHYPLPYPPRSPIYVTGYKTSDPKSCPLHVGSLSSCYIMQRLTAENYCKLPYKKFPLFRALLISKKQTKMKFLLFWRKVVFYTAPSNQDTLKRFDVTHGPNAWGLERFLSDCLHRTVYWKSVGGIQLPGWGNAPSESLSAWIKLWGHGVSSSCNWIKQDN